jgi:Holliday junction DNA helicase RuvA
VIAFLTGRVDSKAADHCVLDVGGVGLRLTMTTGSIAALPAEGESATVHTYLHVREDELALFGFDDAEEKRLFEQLITVSGVGPKVALGVLSSLAPGALVTAVATEDVALLSSVPGIGTKTARRICLELKDRLGPPEGLGGHATAVSATSDEALHALLGMGFSSAEAATALRSFDGDPGDVEELLRHALRRLGEPR